MLLSGKSIVSNRMYQFDLELDPYLVHRIDKKKNNSHLYYVISAPHKFYVGFRYVHPLTEEAIEEMERYVKHGGWGGGGYFK